MRYIIHATLPENHAYNDEWLLKRHLHQIGFQDVQVSQSQPVTAISETVSESVYIGIDDDPGPLQARKNDYGIYVPEDKK